VIPPAVGGYYDALDAGTTTAQPLAETPGGFDA
jgi:hypothetical protein